mgnify:CR=1 FL=1
MITGKKYNPEYNPEFVGNIIITKIINATSFHWSLTKNDRIIEMIDKTTVAILDAVIRNCVTFSEIPRTCEEA